ncbi:MAG: 16S rRNA (uracil(1498)-N(3))-methyltransferase [Clostridium sp.]|nr:16S rRNA (uracil(1498)-N(3))-methyltransferase [Clostridium sp.]
MHKFFSDENCTVGNNINIKGEDVKHIYKVLRLKEGEIVNINNCRGEEFTAEIVYIDKTKVTCKIISKSDINNESKLKIYLFQGMPKSSKMDLIVQKNTELGVSSVTPVITERVIVKNSLGDNKKIERWNKIALEASKQSKRSLIPKVNEAVDFNNMISEIKNYDLVVVPYENKKEFGIKALKAKLKDKEITNCAIVIGPEGGFEESEIEMLKEIGAEIVTLGPRILRTETAGFTCTALIMYELGDIGGLI